MKTTVYVQPLMKEIEIDLEGMICQSVTQPKAFIFDSDNNFGEEIEC